MVRLLITRRSERAKAERHRRGIPCTPASRSSFKLVSVCAALVASCGGSSGTPATHSVNDLLAATDGSATFSTALTPGGNYTVSVQTQPTSRSGVAAAATRLYFANGTEYGSPGGGQEGWLSNLIGYAANSSGSVSATLTITSKNLTDRYICVTTDVSGYVYVTTHGAFGPAAFSGILVFGPDQDGMAAPSRTLTVPGFPGVIALDRAGDVYVVASFPSPTGEAPGAELLEFAAGASGHATPVRTINLSDVCTQLAVDGNGNILCASFRYMSNEIRVFTSDPSSNVTPARTLSLASDLQLIDFCLDAFGNIFVAVQDNGTRILELPGGAGGTGVLSSVAGIPDGTLGSGFFVTHLRFDAAGNLYVFGVAEGAGQSLLRFAPTGGGFASAVSETLMSPRFSLGFVEPIVAGFAVH